MSLDRTSIDKEIQRLGVEALMFQELPKVENALNEMCQKWFFDYSETNFTGAIDVSGNKQDTSSPQPTITIVGSAKEKKKSANCFLWTN